MTLSPHDSLHSSLPGSAHVVQFYDREEFLYRLVAEFIGEGLRSGEPAVIIATAEHTLHFREQLEADGFSLDGVLFLDANEILGSFMDGSMPDGERFGTAVGGVLENLFERHKPRRLRAYGEMVDILWREGKPEAAIRLEQLWNELAGLYRFALLCAYPMANFYKESDAPLFEQICETHGRVRPTEKYSQIADDDARAREVSALQQRAEALANEVARREAIAVENARLYQLAQQANRAKDEFLATISHELRTPLTAILGWARLLSLGGLDAEAKRVAIETIERSARTQATLIDDLLDISRVVTGKLTLQNELVDLASVIQNAEQTLRLAAEGKDIRVELEGVVAGTLVNGDPTRLQQIVWNLLSNAIKFSGKGGRVAVTLDRAGDVARIVVRDEGRGIAPAFLPHVFEAFRQADGAPTRSHGGLGLGLAIVKYLAEMHGGTVHAASDGPGCGATFTVTLPLAPEPC